MRTTYAFDVYGTLVDPLGITNQLSRELGSESASIAREWRDKQLEYLFRRALMGRYRDFSVCTEQALDFVLANSGCRIDQESRQRILLAYRRLPAFSDAAGTLTSLRAAGHRAFAFSNGVPDDLDEVLRHAGLHGDLDGIVSVHSIRSFKPDPAVYEHFVTSTGSDPRATWLVSGNPFDVIGAAECGWNTVWVQRNSGQVFDPWGLPPTRTVASLADLA